ncbi:MAG TPA: hypothetical protein PK307_14200 [Spirochaetota bacterium]|nr:hypothetical protein [Spirochaetota bacterium]HOD14180.1 hypothetical protein [Spirochaetota bacterium]HPG51196.1 hypothetical protein [Spirochaetota bacterium]HPN13118.1 hypothetical protein [Spirochaetota bacterium]HQL83351.1 hypothetical protein [Spirochaetota bacterium]
MKIITYIMLSLLLVSVFACSRSGKKEKEPNNSFATAGDISLDARFTGFMDTPNDRDFYRLIVDKPGVIDVNCSGVKGINLAVKVWKGEEEPRLLKWLDDNRKSSPERLANLGVIPGTYYFEVLQSDRDTRKASSESAYELELKSREAISEESEPNDSKDEADSIHQDREITGFYSPAYNRLNNNTENLHREEDWFVVDVVLGSDMPALITVSLSGVTEINAILSLYDADDNLIATADNGGAGEQETITGAGIQKSGSYYIVVASKGYTVNNDEPYTLKVAMLERDSGVEMEKNDDFDSANGIVNNVITGKINSRKDRDLFLYTVARPSAFRIELRPADDMDTICSIYSKDNEKIIDINNSGSGRKEVYPNFFTDKDFYIEVSMRSRDSLPTGEYVLSITPLEETEGMEREPNNDTPQANGIKGNAISGFTSFRGDKDYFRLSYDSRVKERFEIRSGRGGEIRVSVTDPLGYIIKTVDVKGDKKAIFSEMIDKKGYILVESLTESYDYPYTINLRGGE